MDDKTMNNGLKHTDGRDAGLPDEMVDKVVGGSNAYLRSVTCGNCGKFISNRFAHTIRIDGNTFRVCSSCAETMNQG